MKTAIAVACSDIHLSDKAPKARSGEPDWHKKQEEALSFLVAKALEFDVPLIVAGDIFHVPRSTPAMELLAMRHLTDTSIIMIPGQHDLPNHLYDNVGRSSYGVLTAHLWGGQNECIIDAPVGKPTRDIECNLFVFGAERTGTDSDAEIKIAIMHDLVWKGEAPYPGAPEGGNVKNLVKSMPGYDFIVAGDNHKGFAAEVDGTMVVNCGSMMRRTADQEGYKPRCYVLYDDKTVEALYLPIGDDVFSREHVEDKNERDARVEAFVSHLKDIEVELSFEVNMERFIKAHDTDADVANKIRRAMNG